ncbi:Stress response kinase A [BD1-7 clade bacterium]|uniref:Stress response kinase A n=1 Tax=BD1-7 clade bacterium TaxID=2029982 RepID=A0A5S9N5F3_9GAMM|nr:Stress response kinase A [BD1-7 clade bacterium]CAA0084053.1 Stress response kinase A [BD1-7 clade bacterium]
MNSDAPSPPVFSQLTPESVIDAIESLGFFSDGRQLALNSYENRVYQVGIEDDVPVIAKFYRPQRWENAQILEEHAFCAELAEQEVSVVCPLEIHGQTLHVHEGMRFAVFPRQGGRAPELDNPDQLFSLAQTIGRMHCVGASKPFEHRPELSIERFGVESAKTLVGGLLPENLREVYESVAEPLLDRIRMRFDAIDVPLIRCHGDCHMGNVLWRDDKPHFVDFDDISMAPAIQDLWMLLSGDRHQQTAQLQEIVEGYEMFMPFDAAQLTLIEPLRTLRIMHYAAWLARRWDDPAFPMHFPWFNTDRYWGEHILELKEQLALLDEPALVLQPF